MTGLIYRFCCFLIRFAGISCFVRLFISKNKVSMVMYHNPKPEVFEKHLNYLTRKYNLISLAGLAHAIKTRNLQEIPKHALIITLDDGWKENFHLLPVIRKYNFRPAIFLTSHLVDTGRCFWWTKCKPEDIEPLKRITNIERLSRLKDKYDFHPDRDCQNERQVLNLSEIEKMKDFVDFGLHSCYHPVLTKCSSEEKITEIVECKREVESKLGIRAEAFAYPNGDYDDECIGILKECGIKIARTTDVGWNSETSNPYKLKITGVSDNGSVSKLAAELTGIPMFFQYLFFKGSFNGIRNRAN